MHSFFPKEIYKLPNLKFPRQMIEKRLPSLAVKIRNVSSISNKLSPDTATISLVLLLSDFSLHWSFVFGYSSLLVAIHVNKLLNKKNFG